MSEQHHHRRNRRRPSHAQLIAGQTPSQFQCSICSRYFTRRDNLRSHYRIHTGERPFSCSYCGRAFRWQSALRNHEDLHVVNNQPATITDNVAVSEEENIAENEIPPEIYEMLSLDLPAESFRQLLQDLQAIEPLPLTITQINRSNNESIHNFIQEEEQQHQRDQISAYILIPEQQNQTDYCPNQPSDDPRHDSQP